MKIVVVALAWMLIAAIAGVAAGEPQAPVLGGGVTIEQATPIVTLLAAPQDHVGKRVRIDGVITEVCPRHGDWIKVATPRSGSGILVWVNGSAFSFSSDCVTRPISVEGVFEGAREEAAMAQDGPHEDEGAPHVCAVMTRLDSTKGGGTVLDPAARSVNKP